MVGDGDEVAIVDPKFDIDDYLEAARYQGVEITHVLETHNHADHVSGHGRLAAATGATIHIHRDADPGYEAEPFDDGWELRLGDCVVRAIHTPGHRPEHTAFSLTDTSRSDDPWAVLTGDTLFVGDIARPDLAIDKEDGARGIYESLHGKLLKLPPETEVWPGHLGGSMCGSGAMSPKISSTLGYEMANNELLGISDEEKFVEGAIARIGAQPPNFENIVEINRGELLTESLDAHPLAPRQLQRRVDDGVLVIDVRTSLQFDDAHIPGATHITILGAGFASKLAWLAEPDEEIVFVGRDDDDGLRAIELAQSVGMRNLGGYLHGGFTSWREEGRATEGTERIEASELKSRVEAGEVTVLDVREEDEWRSGHIPGAVFKPWHDIDGIPDGVDPGKPVATICGSGARAGVAASLLQRFGHEHVVHVADGVSGWKREGGEIESE